MARLFFTGGETGAAEWNGGNPGAAVAPTVTSAVKRTGSYSILCNALSAAIESYFRQIFETNETELYGRFALYLSSSIADVTFRIVRFNDQNNAQQFAIVYDSGTACLRWEGSAGSYLAQGFVFVPTETWVVVEFYTLVGSSGQLTLKINGTTGSTYSGNTDTTSVGNIRSMYFGIDYTGAPSSSSRTIYLDDIAVNNADGDYENNYAGLGGVFYLKPNADGDQIDWTPSAGTVNYAMVDETPPDNATTFNQGYGSGAIDLYEVDDCPLYIAEVNCLQVAYRSALVTSGYNELTDLVKVSGTVYQGIERTIVPITPSFSYYLGTVHYLNPASGSAWGTAEVNAMQAGIEITT